MMMQSNFMQSNYVQSNYVQNNFTQDNYQIVQMQKEMILERLREKGCRITKQRINLIDIILENEVSSCKEIFYKALEQDEKLGVATVYRMVNLLEEIGAISRKNMYRVAYCEYQV